MVCRDPRTTVRESLYERHLSSGRRLGCRNTPTRTAAGSRAGRWRPGSFFVGFGISAASLLFLNCGVGKIPVTHHMTLPPSTAALIPGSGPDAVVALVVGAVFGIYGALLAEVHHRIFYAHSDTHWDPPAASIVVTTLTIAVLASVGVFPDAGWVPLPV